MDEISIVAVDKIKKVGISILCQQDFLERYDRMTPANRKFEIKEMHDWLKDMEIKCEKSDVEDRSKLLKLISELPKTRFDIEDIVYEKFKSLMIKESESFPDAIKYMERLVERFADEDIKQAGGSVRLKIVKQFVRYSKTNTKPIVEYVLKFNELPKNEDKAEFVIKNLSEDVFNLLKSNEMNPFKKLRCLIYSVLSKKEFKAEVKWKELENRLNQNNIFCENMITKEYLMELEKEISLNYADKRNHVEYSDIPEESHRMIEKIILASEQLFSTITKPKVKKDNSLAPIYEVKTLYNSKLKDSKTEQNPLLIMADDLANGRFRNFGVTREYLYKFALVFGLTFSLEKTNKKNDMEKNLLYDFYNYNKEFFNEKIDSDERGIVLDVSGEGINWKNFVEAVYIYYIGNSSNKLNRKQKLSNAEAMIERRKKAGSAVNHANKTSPTTTYFKMNAVYNNVFNMSEDKFEKYVSENFDLHKYDRASDTNYIKYASEQVSAREVMEFLKMRYSRYIRGNSGIRGLKTRNQTIKSLAEQLENSKYSRDICENWEEHIKNLLPHKQKNDYLNMEEISKVLIELALDTPFDEFRTKIYSEQDENVKVVMERVLNYVQTAVADITAPPSRNRIIALFANVFYNENTDLSTDFIRFKRTFVSGLNEQLGRCRYQLFSEKNFFDVFGLFMLYYVSIQF